jgi:hypothetical protein
MPTDLTEEDLKGLEGMCRRRQGRRMTVTLDLDVLLALVRDARALRRVADTINAVDVALLVQRLEGATTEPASERGEERIDG